MSEKPLCHRAAVGVLHDTLPPCESNVMLEILREKEDGVVFPYRGLRLTIEEAREIARALNRAADVLEKSEET